MLYLCSEIPSPLVHREAGSAVEGIAGYSKALFSMVEMKHSQTSANGANCPNRKRLVTLSDIYGEQTKNKLIY